MATITVTIADTPHGMRIATTACKPAAGQPLTPAESWTVDLLRLCNRGSVEITYGCLDIHAQALSEFAQRLLSPDDLGHAVTGEVRRCAQEALGRNTSIATPIATPFPPLEAA